MVTLSVKDIEVLLCATTEDVKEHFSPDVINDLGKRALLNRSESGRYVVTDLAVAILTCLLVLQTGYSVKEVLPFYGRILDTAQWN